jgi:hypothetical protein
MEIIKNPKSTKIKIDLGVRLCTNYFYHLYDDEFIPTSIESKLFSFLRGFKRHRNDVPCHI